MKKIVPFKKDMLFNTDVSEITSISLEHDLKVHEGNVISGNFLISGDYKMSDASINTESFNFELPCNINLDEKYVLDDVVVDIDDFYYEVVNSNILQVNIDVSLDNLEEKEVEETILNEIKMPSAQMPQIEEYNPGERELKIKEECNNEVRCVEAEDVETVTSIFDSFDDNLETYQTYKVYIVREGDTIETVMQKYGIGKEELQLYNDLTEINLGDKLIIPEFLDAKN